MSALEDLLRRRTAARRTDALARAARVVAALAAIGVEARICGSLASGRFRLHSDVDLLITRCPHALRYAIEGLIENGMAPLPFDAIYLDEVPPEQAGRLLAEARDASALC